MRRPSSVAAAIAAVCLLAGCTGGHDPVDRDASGNYRFAGSGATVNGKTIPVDNRKTVGPVSAEYLTNGSGTFTLASLRGQVVVLNFWGVWCPPCRLETPAFDKVYRSTKSQGVTFVGIDTKDDSKSTSRAFIRDNNISYPIVWDKASRTALQLGRIPAGALPMTAVIDKHGKMAAVYIGTVQAGDLYSALASLVAET